MGIIKQTCASAALVLVFASPSIAAERCDPDKILRSNVDQYNENVVYFLSYLKNLASQTDKSDSSSFGVSYAGVGLNYADASSLSQFISQQEKFVITKDQSISILRSTLSADSVRAYIACISNPPPLTIKASDSALSEAVFPFSVQWTPGYRAKTSELLLKVTNGTIDGKIEKKTSIQPTDELPFTVTRDGDGSKTLIIVAYVDGKTSDAVYIPGFPQFEVKLRQKFVPPLAEPEAIIQRSGHFGTPYVKVDLCLYPTDSNSRLLPSTMKFAGTVVGDPNRAKSTVKKAENNSLSACGFFENSAGGDTDYNKISGRFFVYEAYTEHVKAPAEVGAKASPARAPLRASNVQPK